MKILRQDERIVLVRSSRDGGRTPVPMPAHSWAPSLADYAILSALVYGLDDSAALLEPPAGWTRHEVHDCRRSGFHAELWTNGPRAAIVYRGTVNHPLGLALRCWWNNARWLTRFVPGASALDQYARVRQTVAAMAGHARRLGATHIAAAGHSLGGGLAQMAAQQCPHIASVYAFNASPVTGFWNAKGSAHIFRVYEHGEILAYLRRWIRKLRPLSPDGPETLELRFNFRQGRPIQQHSMHDLARQLDRLRQRV